MHSLDPLFWPRELAVHTMMLESEWRQPCIVPSNTHKGERGSVKSVNPAQAQSPNDKILDKSPELTGNSET